MLFWKYSTESEFSQPTCNLKSLHKALKCQPELACTAVCPAILPSSRCTNFYAGFVQVVAEIQSKLNLTVMQALYFHVNAHCRKCLKFCIIQRTWSETSFHFHKPCQHLELNLFLLKEKLIITELPINFKNYQKFRSNFQSHRLKNRVLFHRSKIMNFSKPLVARIDSICLLLFTWKTAALIIFMD